MHVRPATTNDTAAIGGLLALRTEADQRPALTEYKAAARQAATGVELVAIENGAVVAYAIAAFHGPATVGVEVVPAPATDQEAAVRSLLTQLRMALPEGTTGYVWAWRDADRAAAESIGLERERLLATLGRTLEDIDVATYEPPDGVVLRTFRVGIDEEAWLEANAAAFAEHPETGAIDQADLARRLAEPWFDPAGFLLAEDRNGRLLGYCWTKLHHNGVGEIYIIGVIPDARHMGLGTVLLDAGMVDLAGRQQATSVELYMDGNDEKLRAFYEQRGFVRIFENVAYQIEAQPNR